MKQWSGIRGRIYGIIVHTPCIPAATLQDVITAALHAYISPCNRLWLLKSSRTGRLHITQTRSDSQPECAYGTHTGRRPIHSNESSKLDGSRILGQIQGTGRSHELTKNGRVYSCRRSAGTGDSIRTSRRHERATQSNTEYTHTHTQIRRRHDASPHAAHPPRNDGSA